MMHVTSRRFAMGLAFSLLIGNTLPALAETVWIPRLGFTTQAAKHIYLEAPTKEELEARKEAEKNQKKADEPKKEEKKPAQTSDKPMTREQARKQADKERMLRKLEIAKGIQEKRENKPVRGEFYLYNVKQNRLMYQVGAEAQSASPSGIAPFVVNFNQPLPEGIYDVAVLGSGHRSVMPLRVSDAIYWDAMKPVLQDITKAHCPMQPGRFFALQHCYQINIQDGNTINPVSRLILGGWYVENTPDNGVVKDTAQIANLAQELTQVYTLNPRGLKYLTLSGDTFAQSSYPDLLDEINWGMQYLLTIQNEDGSFPSGIEKRAVDGKSQYHLLPSTPESTARAVMALANGVDAFQEEDLSLSVKFLRAAQRGWQAMAGKWSQVDPETYLLTSAAMMNASDLPEYAEAFQTAKAQVKSISPQTAILLGKKAEGLAISETEYSDHSSIAMQLPMAAQLQQGNTAAANALRQWVTSLFGYEKVELIRDSKLERVAAWIDPLQWMAHKTGDVATRLGQKITDTGVYRGEAELKDPKFLKTIESKETATQKWLTQGYEKIQLTTQDKAHLVLILGLLNQHTAATAPPPEVKKEIRPERTPKGYFPKPI